MNLSNFDHVNVFQRTRYNQNRLFQGLHCYFVDCCTKIKISSDGVLNGLGFAPASGLYQYIVQNNGKRAYKQENTRDYNGVFYLHWSPFKTWTVCSFFEI